MVEKETTGRYLVDDTFCLFKSISVGVSFDFLKFTLLFIHSFIHAFIHSFVRSFKPFHIFKEDGLQ